MPDDRSRGQKKLLPGPAEGEGAAAPWDTGLALGTPTVGRGGTGTAWLRCRRERGSVPWAALVMGMAPGRALKGTGLGSQQVTSPPQRAAPCPTFGVPNGNELASVST